MELSYRRKAILIIIFILLLLSSGITRHTHLILTSNSWNGLLKFLFYLTMVIFGVWYIWRRLVKDVENDQLQMSGGGRAELPPPIGKHKSSSKSSQNEAVYLNNKLVFAVWKILVQFTLIFIVFGFILVRSKVANRKISFPEFVSYIAVGSGSFLLICLVFFDLCIFLYLILSKFIHMCVRIVQSTYHVTEFDYQINSLLPSHLLCFTLKDLNLKRRTIFPSWKKAVCCLVLTVIISIYSLVVAHNGPYIRKTAIAVHRLPTSMNGFKIAMISDLHIGPWLWKQNLETVIRRINNAEPDLIAIVGDLVDMTVMNMHGAIDPIGKLQAKKGVFFVSGNHDYYSGGIDEWFSYLRDKGINVLDNKNQKICLHENSNSSDCFSLVGTEDFSAGKYEKHSFSLNTAMEGVDPDMATILLTHQPLGAKEAIFSQFNFDLILSGHTHGGQFFPASIAIYFTSPFFSGLYHPTPHTYLYVSTGAWYWGVPMRFLASPEIPLITLISDDD